jgi:hypothetical protein
MQFDSNESNTVPAAFNAGLSSKPHCLQQIGPLRPSAVRPQSPHLLGLGCLHLGLLHLCDGAHGLAGHGHGRHVGWFCLESGKSNCEMSCWMNVNALLMCMGGTELFLPDLGLQP